MRRGRGGGECRWIVGYNNVRLDMARAPVFLCSLSCVTCPPSSLPPPPHQHIWEGITQRLDNKFVSCYYLYKFYLILSQGIARELMEGKEGKGKNSLQQQSWELSLVGEEYSDQYWSWLLSEDYPFRSYHVFVSLAIVCFQRMNQWHSVCQSLPPSFIHTSNHIQHPLIITGIKYSLSIFLNWLDNTNIL